jgi:2-polyprenyl-3-methyl-5-hydroxy-6-metoxy-1,4-benzoquinol methylase
MQKSARSLAPCPQCFSYSIELRERRRQYRYAQCRECSLVFVVNPPPESVLVQQYHNGQSSRVQYYQLAKPADSRSFRRLLALIERFSPRGRILDVGCNIGTFVMVARERGWDAAGVDVNHAAVRYGRTSSGLNLYTVDELETLEVASFDVLHSSDTIEHLVDPADTLRQYLRHCRPGGIVVLSTPNYDSLFCRLLQLKPTEHVRLFNATSLARLCNAVGLNVLHIATFDRHRCISAMFESTTFEGLRPLRQAFRLLYRVAPSVTIRLPLKENVLVVARKM